jgi:hypothetical protein
MSLSGRIAKYLIPVIVTLVIVAISAMLIADSDGVVPPRIELLQTSAAVPVTVYSFPFEDFSVTLTGSVDPAVYYGAKAANKQTQVRGNISDSVWLRETYLSMINDPAQETLYSSLIGTFRSIRSQKTLDDDEYLELMTVFVQSIPYESLSENPPKFPVETYFDRSGDCDDKSLLLAGLLSREGYNVSLLSFSPEAHMAVGAVCPGGEYKGSGYAYIETTNLSFAGVPTKTLGDDIPLVSAPYVIRIGNGTKIYQSCSDSLYLDSFYQNSEKRVADLTEQIDSLKEEMDRYYADRDIRNYNMRVPIFNNLQKVRLQYAEVHNYILEHQFDRKGTYRYVKENLPE